MMNPMFAWIVGHGKKKFLEAETIVILEVDQRNGSLFVQRGDKKLQIISLADYDIEGVFEKPSPLMQGGGQLRMA